MKKISIHFLNGSDCMFQTKRTKSLVETSHFNTMKLLEQKLGGGVSQEPAPKENDNLYEKQIVRGNWNYDIITNIGEHFLLGDMN